MRSADRNSRTFPIFYIATGNKGDTSVDTEKLLDGGRGEDLLMTVYRIPGETHMVRAGCARRRKGRLEWFA